MDVLAIIEGSMSVFLDFIVDNWLLFTIVVVITVLYIGYKVIF